MRRLFGHYRESGDPADREALVELFLPLAGRLASRYRGSSEPFDDLFQVACLGLLKASDGFDVRKGTAITSYAVPTIIGELKRHFRDKTWAMRGPRRDQELAMHIKRAADHLTGELGRTPSLSEQAAAADAAEEDVVRALEVARRFRVVVDGRVRGPRRHERRVRMRRGPPSGARDRRPRRR